MMHDTSLRADMMLDKVDMMLDSLMTDMMRD
jgi:hypothetical protein